MTDRTIKIPHRSEPAARIRDPPPLPNQGASAHRSVRFPRHRRPPEPRTNDIYVGPHSHRGVQPVSLLFRGRIEHRDSLGNDRTVTPAACNGSSPVPAPSMKRSSTATTTASSTWPSCGSTSRQAQDGTTRAPRGRRRTHPRTHLARPTVDRAPLRRRPRRPSGPAPMPTPVLVAHVTIGAGGERHDPRSGRLDQRLHRRRRPSHVDGAGLGEGDTPVFNDDGTTITMASATGVSCS